MVIIRNAELFSIGLCLTQNFDISILFFNFKNYFFSPFFFFLLFWPSLSFRFISQFFFVFFSVLNSLFWFYPPSIFSIITFPGFMQYISSLIFLHLLVLFFSPSSLRQLLLSYLFFTVAWERLSWLFNAPFTWQSTMASLMPSYHMWERFKLGSECQLLFSSSSYLLSKIAFSSILLVPNS